MDITLELNGTEIRFRVDRETYNRYVNELTPENKVAPSQNFCVRSALNEDQKDLVQFIYENVGAELQIASALVEEYTSKLEITLKKPKPRKSG